MPLRRFALGQSVRLVTNAGISRKVAGSYRVTRFLPERDSSPQYRLMSEDGLHERVAMEDSIEPAAPQDRDTAIVQPGKE
jgi:hypothetical protein